MSLRQRPGQKGEVMAKLLRPSLTRRITANVRKLLRLKGWTEEEISKRSDLDKGNLSRYFSGKRDYTLLSLQRIAEALETDISDLMLK